MRAHVTAAAAVLCSLGAMSTVNAQAPTCENVQYGDEVLERFPNVRKSCLEVAQKGGQTVSLHKAVVSRVHSGGVRVRFLLPDGTKSDPRYIATRKDFRVLVDGKSLRVNELVVGQELTAYVTVDRPTIALQPVAENEPLELVPIVNEPPATELAMAQPEELPKTASLLPFAGLLGGLLTLFGAALTMARRRG